MCYNVLHTFISFAPSRWIAMVKSQSEAATRYRKGVEDFGGAQAYKDCARNNSNSGFLQVAECLQNKSSQSLNTDQMVSNYRDAA